MANLYFKRRHFNVWVIDVVHFLCGVGEGVAGGELEVVASVDRWEMVLIITQETSVIASATFDSSKRTQAWIHHPRETTTRNKPSLPPSSRCPQSSPVASSWGKGQLSVSLRCGWIIIYHCTQLFLKSWTEQISGMLFFPNRQPCNFIRAWICWKLGQSL